MIRIAIVEDEPEQADVLRGMIERFSRESGTQLDVSVFPDGEDFIQSGERFHISFLDIQMERLDGMNTARKVRETNSEMVIIFVTNLAEYAIEGYSVSAMTFLLKPLRYEILRMTAERALAIVNKHPEKSLTVKTDKGTVKIRPAQIYYVEIDNRRLALHTANGIFYCTETMQKMEELLDPERFFRCHVAFLVNLDHVARIDKSGAVVAGDHVLVSKYRKREFMNALTRYVGGKI
ncbi:MAG: response regulator transcription factor [Clostridia bacterium]|nr:response regulator transcription factor [Clostridia bacterium]